MKIEKIINCFYIVMLIVSCKAKVIPHNEATCEVIKTKNDIIYVNDSEKIKKEIDNYDGLIRMELENFYESNYNYDYISYEYLNDENSWVYDRLYFDNKMKKWIHRKRNKENFINSTSFTTVMGEFDKLNKGGFLIKDGSNSGFFKTYLIKRKGVLITEVVKISQTCSLSNTKLNLLSIIENELK